MYDNQHHDLPPSLPPTKEARDALWRVSSFGITATTSRRLTATITTGGRRDEGGTGTQKGQTTKFVPQWYVLFTFLFFRLLTIYYCNYSSTKRTTTGTTTYHPHYHPRKRLETRQRISSFGITPTTSRRLRLPITTGRRRDEDGTGTQKGQTTKLRFVVWPGMFFSYKLN